MRRCIELARNGMGSVYPNPMVGCVIVHNDRIIGEGWHHKAGEAHAEVVAIQSVKEKKLLAEATLYVNLEPCSHFGKTPPCADLIVDKGIKKVVIGTVDSHEKVGGKGVARLRENGVDVAINMLEMECRNLNRRFFTYHEKKRPYVILKWAQSKDGFIFPDREKDLSGTPYWISNTYSRQRVHQWRAEEASILVGKNTILQDDPVLNIRDFTGHPIIRLVIDRELELPLEKKVFNNAAETYIYNRVKQKQIGQLNYVKLDFDNDVIRQLLQHLYKLEVQSLIVEGGTHTIDAFINEGIWDEARVFSGMAHFGKGISAPLLSGRLEQEIRIQEDLLHIYKPGL